MAQYSGYVGFGGPQYAPQPGQFGYAAPAPSAGFQQQAFSGAGQSGFAAPAGSAFGAAAPAAQGYSSRVIAPASIQALYRGKPAFYDAGRGVYFDGRTAYYDTPEGANAFQQQAQAQQFGQASFAGQQQFPAASSVYTAIENPHIVLGNGTQGNLKEHAAALSSQYAFDYAPQYYL